MSGRTLRLWLIAVLCCGGSCSSAPKTPRAVHSPQTGAQPPLAVRPASVLPPKALLHIQRALRARGIELKTNCRFDAATEDGLRSFQAQRGLAATGMPDLATLRALGVDALGVYRQTLAARHAEQTSPAMPDECRPNARSEGRARS